MLLPFKKGAFHFAIQAGIPIVPVVVANYSRLFSIKKHRFKSGTVKIQGNTTLNHTDLVMEPISTTDLTSADVDRIAMETRERMLTVLEDISEKTPNTNGKAINGGASLKKEL
jgi:lysophosphatidate acyltransferase